MVKLSFNAIEEIINDIVQVENVAIELYQSILTEISNKDVKDKIKQIIKDEVKHFRNANEMLSILKDV